MNEYSRRLIRWHDLTKNIFLGNVLNPDPVTRWFNRIRASSSLTRSPLYLGCKMASVWGGLWQWIICERYSVFSPPPMVNTSCHAAEGGRKISFSNYFNEVPNVSLMRLLRENSNESLVEACLSARRVIDGVQSDGSAKSGLKRKRLTQSLLLE